MFKETIKQPAERQQKHILVSLHTEKGLVWSLVPALKVGNSYKVAHSQLGKMLSNHQRGSTVTIG